MINGRCSLLSFGRKSRLKAAIKALDQYRSRRKKKKKKKKHWTNIEEERKYYGRQENASGLACVKSGRLQESYLSSKLYQIPLRIRHPHHGSEATAIRPACTAKTRTSGSRSSPMVTQHLKSSRTSTKKMWKRIFILHKADVEIWRSIRNI